MTEPDARALHPGDSIRWRGDYTTTGEVIHHNETGFTVRWSSKLVEFIRYDSALLAYIERKP